MKSIRQSSLFYSQRWVSVMSEVSPNPEATVFWIDKGSNVLGKGSKSLNFSDRYSCATSPLAGALFKVNGVHAVLLGPNHVTVTKKQEFDWQVVKPSVELVLTQFFSAGLPIVRPGTVESVEELPKTSSGELESVEGKIKGLIAERVRPFVEQDGGDIEFVSFDEESGVVRVKMQGACKGCPKSMITLKMGIERMLKHYVPEVVGVLDVGGDDKPEVDSEQAKEFGP